MGMLTERTGGISIVGLGEVVTMGGEIDSGDGVGKEEPLGSGVYSGYHGLAFSVGMERVAHPGVATLDRRVSGEEMQEVKVVVEVSNGELMICDGWWCEWEMRTEG